MFYQFYTFIKKEEGIIRPPSTQRPPDTVLREGLTQCFLTP